MDWKAMLSIALVAAIWLLGTLRLLVDPQPHVPILFNWTGSLPYHVALVRARTHEVQRGDHVVYRFAGRATERYPGLRDQPFFKQVAGLPGDAITVSNQTILVNGTVIGQVRASDRQRRPLHPLAPQVIPPGHYFMRGISEDSFDSRYAESGLVAAEQILAVVRPLL